MESVGDNMNKILRPIWLSHSNTTTVKTQTLKTHKQHIFEMKIFLLKALQSYLYHVCYALSQSLRKQTKGNTKPHAFHSFHFQTKGEKVAVSLNSQPKIILIIPHEMCILFAFTIHWTLFTKEILVLCQTSLLKLEMALSCLQQNIREKILLCHANGRQIINHVAINKEKYHYFYQAF